MIRPSIAIIGGGSSALFLASQLDEKKYDIAIYEKKARLGSKFLVAGKGGFNLTFDEDIELMATRYIPKEFVQNYLEKYTNIHFRTWLSSLGIDTYTGSSNRVFPVKEIKPIDVFNAIFDRIKAKSIKIYTNYEWLSFDEHKLLFKLSGGEIRVKADYYIWALGGASWKKTGSDGAWLSKFSEAKIKTIPFEPSNCAFGVNWPKQFQLQNESQPLKNILLKSCGKEKSGEVVITSFGLEGNAIYPLSNVLRDQLNKNGTADLFIDLKPMWSEGEVFSKLQLASKKKQGKAKTRSSIIKDSLNLSRLKMNFIKHFVSKSDFQNDTLLAHRLKNLKILIISIAPIDEAISTIGGISLNEIDENLSLKKMPNHFVTGEMLNWDAPTGGYLLQACWSMASHISASFNN